MYNYDEVFLEKYKLAYDKLKAIMEQINVDFSNETDINPIENMKFRIKHYDSLVEKLNNRNLEFTAENIDNCIRDVVGCRVICSFKSDIEKIENKIKKIEKEGILKIVDSKNYVKNPKANGYSSLHIIVSIPVELPNKQIEHVKVEIQIRTVAMDMISSIEHKLTYKKDECSEEISEAIKNISFFCKAIDNNLDEVIKTHTSDQDVSTTNYIKSIDKIRTHYNTALEIVLDKIKGVYDYYDKNYMINIIEHFKGRIKKDSEIVRKLDNKGLDINIDNVINHINDFAGCRIVCSFIDDIEILKDEIKKLEQQGKIKIIKDKEKDYITDPKESGYRGYHFLVSVPVYISNVGIFDVKVEIQLRTVAMEMWASLEEKICYNKNPNEAVKKELVRMSNVIKVLDDEINNAVYKCGKAKNIKKRERKKNNV